MKKMKKLILLVTMLVIITMGSVFNGCKSGSEKTIYEQISEIPKPQVLYDITLSSANVNYGIIICGADQKYYEFSGDHDVIKTIIKRYGINDTLTLYVEFDHVKKQDIEEDVDEEDDSMDWDNE